MNKINPKHPRVLAIAPSTRGFGFAVFAGQEKLADWGVKSVKVNKNIHSLAKVNELITFYQPDVLALENTGTKDSRRSPRIQALTKQILALAGKHKVRVVLFSREQVRKVFFADGKGTKYVLAEILAKRFPEQLGFRLPPKRRLWESEDSRMNIFDAVALVLACRLRNNKNEMPISQTFRKGCKLETK